MGGARIRNDDFKPAYSEGRCVFGDFNGDGNIDACVISNATSGYFTVYIWWGKEDGTFSSYRQAAHLAGNASNINGRLTAGDYNGDGLDEIAFVSSSSSSSAVLYVLENTSASGVSFVMDEWYISPNTISCDKMTGRMVSGNFTSDDTEEIAFIYGYNASSDCMKIFMFDEDVGQVYGNTRFTWFTKYVENSSEKDASKVTGRMTAGDYNGDGHEDIAVIYDTGNGTMKLNVYAGSATGHFSAPVAWYAETTASYFDASRVTDTVTSGDYNNDGRDDVAVVYRYGTYSDILVFTSTGSSFNDWFRWHEGKRNYLYEDIKGRIATVDNGDGIADSLIAVYPESDSGYAIYRWDKKTNSSSFELNNTLLHTWNSEYYYGENENVATSTVVKRETFNECETYEYTYDKLGNVTSVTLVLDYGDTEERTLLKEYKYDALGQLITEDVKDKYITEYTYDNGGNIISKYTREYFLGSPYYQGTTTNYTYGDTEWKDLLTSFNGENITYDEIGNPETYIGGSTLTWKDGRRLATFSKNGLSMSFEYDMDGIRQTKTVNDQTTKYFTSGSTILRETRPDGTNVYFYYDDLGNIAALEYDGAMYYYIRNILGEIMALSNSSGEYVAFYEYDAYGAPLSVTNEDGEDVSNDPTSIAYINPYRYKGYYYDVETGFYYLNSRYYDPETGRFINADGLVSTGQGMTGFNMFAYCDNNPVMFVDYTGNKPGDLFDTMDEAAIDFAKCYNALSISDMQEYGSAIYMVIKTNITHRKTPWYLLIIGFRYSPIISVTIKYSYTEPAVGKKGNSVIPNFSTTNPIVSTVHTHANYDPIYGEGNENFSRGFATDIGWSNFFRMDSYVVTPGGYLKKYTYANRNDKNGGVSVIPAIIPWDPNSPDHLTATEGGEI